MSNTDKQMRINKVLGELNVKFTTIQEFLKKKGINIDLTPNSKIDNDIYEMLINEFQSEKNIKEESLKTELFRKPKESTVIEESDNFTDDSNSETTTKDEEYDDIEQEKESATELLIKKNIVADKPQKVTQVSAQKKSEEKIKIGFKIIGKIESKEITKKTEKVTKEKDVKDKKSLKHEDKEKEIDSRKEEQTKEVDGTDIDLEKNTEKIEQTEITGLTETESKSKYFIKTKYEKITGPSVVGKIDLNVFKKPKKRKPEKKIDEETKETKPKSEKEPSEKGPSEKGPSEKGPSEKESSDKVPVASSQESKFKKRKRKRIKDETLKDFTDARIKQFRDKKKFKIKDTKKASEISDEEIEKQIKETLASLTSPKKSKASKYRRQRRDQFNENLKTEQEEKEKQKKVIKVIEFLTVNDLATMMDVHVNQVISSCLNLGLFVSINQRLDAEAISLVADEFGFDVEFASVDEDVAVEEDDDNNENKVPVHPVVTVMGHVDHGKTSLLDYIRKTNVIAGEAGGITQHIGAYEVTLDDEKKITFLDTPGHEAFTAMRARGAKLTDIAIIVIAADEKVMPQTVEAINHARAAGVPMVFAINKIDKPTANTEKIKEQLAQMNILVEDWGGKYRSQEISAKYGTNTDELLEKVLSEAKLLALKASPDKPAQGAVIESSLDKGRGYVTKVLVQDGTLRIGDIVVAGSYHGKAKALFNERNISVSETGPSTPVLLLGLHGAPQAGDKFAVYSNEKEAKQVCVKRQQLIREQGLRTQKHITLAEIGRRIAIGDFKELNIIVKGDVDGSVEALSDSLLKLSTDKIQVNVIHKSVGQIIESDILLASASNAIIVGFQVRPSLNARKLAEQEQIDIRTYSVIYNAIEEIKSAIEGMLEPVVEEKIVCNIEVREIFKITKIGTIAGCMVLDGKIHKNTKVRVIRDGIVIYNGKLSSLKRFKEDVKEVSSGYECGLSIEKFNDIKIGDIVEGYELIEVK